jgi:hypothetical protein
VPSAPASVRVGRLLSLLAAVLPTTGATAAGFDFQALQSLPASWVDDRGQPFDLHCSRAAKSCSPWRTPPVIDCVRSR